MFASQDEELRARIPDYGIYNYMPQFSWFADTVRDAVKELVNKEFLVGLVHRSMRLTLRAKTKP